MGQEGETTTGFTGVRGSGFPIPLTEGDDRLRRHSGVPHVRDPPLLVVVKRSLTDDLRITIDQTDKYTEERQRRGHLVFEVLPFLM